MDPVVVPADSIQRARSDNPVFNFIRSHPFKLTEGNWLAGVGNYAFWIVLAVLAVRYFRRK